MQMRLPKKFLIFGGGGFLIFVVLAAVFSLLTSLQSARLRSVPSGSVVGAPAAFNVPTPGFSFPSFGESSDVSKTTSVETKVTETGELAEKKIIKTAQLTLEVDNVPKINSNLEDVAKTYKGFVQDSTLSKDSEGAYRGTVVVRVPADQFEEALKAVRGLAREIVYENVGGKDVTEEYVDLQARLRTLEASERQFLKILEKAVKIDEILSVQRELERVRGQIESIKGRIQYLERQSDLATITVSLRELPEAALIKIGTWKPLVTLKNAWRTALNAVQNLGKFIIWLITYGMIALVYAAVILLPVVFIAGRGGRRVRKILEKLWGRAVPPPPPPPPPLSRS